MYLIYFYLLFNLANIPLNLILQNLEIYQYYPMEIELPAKIVNRNGLNTYSDDSVTFVSPKIILDYIENVKSFTRVSGQVINEEKTKLLYSFTPEETEITELENKGLLRENFYFPGREINALGFSLKIGMNLKRNSVEILDKFTEYIRNRIKPWEIVSKSFNERKILANTLLISKVNYSLPLLFGLDVKSFKKLQGVIDKFIFAKKIYPGKGKYCNKRVGGLGSPEIYYRYISSQLSWIKKLVEWDDIEIELLPQWVIPFQTLLEKYELPKSKIVLGMGSTIISYISDLCLKENLLDK